MSVIDAVLSVALMLACAAPLGLAAAWFTSRGPNALADFFRPGASLDLGWPHGVQEEDAPTWNWDDRARPADTTAIPPARPDVEIAELDAGSLPVSPVVRQIGRGSSRRDGRW